jgi:hypothetical protein
MKFGEFKLPRAVLQPIYRKVGQSYVEIPNRRAIVGENGKIYDIVSDRYELILHETVVNTIRKIMEDSGVNFEEEIKVNYDGSFMRAIYLIDTKDVLGDILKLGFVATNSYNRTSGINITGFIYRIACKNGLVVKEDIFGRRFKHYSFVATADYEELKKSITTVIDELNKIPELIEFAIKETVSALDIVHFIETEFKNVVKLKKILYMKLKNELNVDFEYWLVVYKGLKDTKAEKRKEILSKLEIPETNLWNTINVMTELTTHYPRLDEKVRYDLSKRISKLLVKVKEG